MPYMVQPVVFLRQMHTNGPAPVQAGVRCLQQLTKSYFVYHNKNSVHVPNIVIFHTNGLSSPGLEIETNFLTWLHMNLFDENFSQR